MIYFQLIFFDRYSFTSLRQKYFQSMAAKLENGSHIQNVNIFITVYDIISEI